MGAFYNSICLPGCQLEAVHRSLARWLPARGFERSDEPALFDLDGDNERSVFVLSNERWTVLFFSHFDEELRLIHELLVNSSPLLYVWVQDSDVWGYDLFDGQGFAGSFNCNPRSYSSFAEQALAPLHRPPADPATLCQKLGLPRELAAEIIRLHHRRAAFKEDICREFCHCLGVDAAVASYDDLECGNHQLLAGWQLEHLLFVQKRYDTGEIDIHNPELLARRFSPSLPRAAADFEIPPELRAEMERMRRRARILLLLLKPVSWLARSWRRLYETSFWLRAPLKPPTVVGNSHPVQNSLPPNYRILGRDLVSDRHGCRITLTEAAEPVSGSRKPSSVFAFKIDSVHVTCTARRLSKIDEVLRAPSGARLLSDDSFLVGDLRARSFLFELPARFVAGGNAPSYLGMSILQTAQALYVFLYRHTTRPSEHTIAGIRATVASFGLVR